MRSEILCKSCRRGCSEDVPVSLGVKFIESITDISDMSHVLRIFRLSASCEVTKVHLTWLGIFMLCLSNACSRCNNVRLSPPQFAQ